MFKLRKILFRILGLDYNHILRAIDFVYLKKDRYANIGSHTYENGAKVYRWSDANLKIGKYCSIAKDVNFIMDDANHSIGSITSFPIFDNLYNDNEHIGTSTKSEFLALNRKKQGITVGNDVWIGLGSTILPGVVIGDGVTIAAGSIVSSSIPPYSVVGGVPAKVIRNKCNEEAKSQMQAIAWWNWSEETIENRALDFVNLSIEQFIQKYK